MSWAMFFRGMLMAPSMCSVANSASLRTSIQTAFLFVSCVWAAVCGVCVLLFNWLHPLRKRVATRVENKMVLAAFMMIPFMMMVYFMRHTALQCMVEEV